MGRDRYQKLFCFIHICRYMSIYTYIHTYIYTWLSRAYEALTWRGETALHLAASHGQAEAAIALVLAGADPSARTFARALLPEKPVAGGGGGRGDGDEALVEWELARVVHEYEASASLRQGRGGLYRSDPGIHTYIHTDMYRNRYSCIGPTPVYIHTYIHTYRYVQKQI